VVVDRNPAFCRAASDEGLAIYEGDALAADTLEEAGARWADTIVAVTRNAELNALVVQKVRDNFRVERALALHDQRGDGAHPRDALFPGEFPGVDEVNRLLRQDRPHFVEYEIPRGNAVGRRLADLPYGASEFALVLRRGDSALIATGDWCCARRTAPGFAHDYVACGGLGVRPETSSRVGNGSERAMAYRGQCRGRHSRRGRTCRRRNDQNTHDTRR